MGVLPDDWALPALTPFNEAWFTSLHFASEQLVPHTMLSSSSIDPRMMLPQSSARLHTLPQTMLLPSAVFDAPQVTSSRHAFASGFSTPPPMR